MTWPTLKVGDVLTLKYGKALKTEDRDGGNFPVVGSGGVAGSHSESLTGAPAIVVGRKGSIGSLTYLETPCWPIDTAYYVEIDESRFDWRWIYWALASLNLGAMNKSAAVPGLNRDDVYRRELSIPPLPEQRRIASILDLAAKLGAVAGRRMTLTTTLKQSLFRDRFGPEPHLDFDMVSLGELIDPERPISYGILKPGPHIPDGVPYIRVTDFYGGVVAVDKVRRTSSEIDHEFRRSRLKAGDLLFSIRGHVGRTAIVPELLDGANITQDTARLALREVDPEFLREWLATPFAQLWMRQRTKGAAVKGINLGDLRLLPVPVPAVETQNLFGDQIRTIDVGLVHQSNILALAEQLMTSLQSRAFRGEL